MRRVAAVCSFAVASIAFAAHAAPASIDPTFLGIGFDGTSYPVLVTSVEPDSGAAAAGLLRGDEILRVDGKLISGADFRDTIATFRSGDTIHLLVERAGKPLSLAPTLSTRQEILQRRFVDRKVPSTRLLDVEDGQVYDLAQLHGRPAIIAWEMKQCGGCDAIVEHVADWAGQQRGAGPLVLAVSTADPEVLRHAHRSAPIASTTPDVFGYFAMDDNDVDRVIFTVIDGDGEVSMIDAVAAPSDANGEVDADAARAAIENVIAACEQAERHAPRH